MENPLLDFGSPAPAPSQQSNVKQSLGLDFDPFATSPAPAPQQQQQQQPPPQPAATTFDAFGIPQSTPQQQQQQPTANNVDPFGILQAASGEQQQVLDLGQPSPEKPTGDAPGSSAAHAQQPEQLDFGAFETQSASTTGQPEPEAQTGSSSNGVVTVDAISGSAPSNGVSQQTTAAAAAAVGVSEGSSSAKTPTGPMDTKAKLKEIQHLFGGRWRLIRSDPFSEYLKALGVGLVTRNRASSGSTDLHIGVRDEMVCINSSSVLHSQIIKLTLDEAVESQWMKTGQSIFCSYQDEKLELQMTPVGLAWSKTHGIMYSFNERKELIVTYTVGSHSCRRVFAKVMVVVG